VICIEADGIKKETSGKKRQQENQKQNSGMSEETPEQ
jgi:hypothetical protein